MRCCDFVCLRCSQSLHRDLVCNACVDRVVPASDRLPFDQREREWRGLWLRQGEFQAWSATCLSIIRHPISTFAGLADGDSDRSWRFAWLTLSLCLFVDGVLRMPYPMLLIHAPLFAAACSTFDVFSAGAVQIALRRLFGDNLPWSLSLRAAGYAAAWWIPAFVFNLVALVAPLPVHWFAFAALTVLMAGNVVALYAFGRGHGGLSIFKAALIALIALTPTALTRVCLLLLPLRG